MLCAYSSNLMTTLDPNTPCLLFHPDDHLGVICSREQQQKTSKSTSLVHVAAAKEPHTEQMNKWLKGQVGELQAEPTSLCRHNTKTHKCLLSNDVAEIAHLQQIQAPTVCRHCVRCLGGSRREQSGSELQ